MPDYTYLIIGGGMTGDAALHGIREVDRTGSIGVIASESHPPYNRPPLSKALWKGKPLDSIYRKDDEQGVTFHFGRTARKLDLQTKRVTDDQGSVYFFDKLLLATGSKPRRLQFGNGQIIYFRTLDDYQRLHRLAAHGRRFAVIGGGFIGSELAAALAMNGKEVVMFFPDDAIGSQVFPQDLAKSVTNFYREKGVELLAETTVVGLDMRQGKTVLKLRSAQTKSEREIEADGVVAGIGVEPNIELAQAAGLEVENGIRVNASLRTNQEGIYAAGDAASFHNPALDKWLRVEHEDNANTMGRMAGRNMAGKSEPYDHLPSFYSDLFDLGYEAVGELDARLETFADWKNPFREGVVYYLRDGRVRGVLLWNVWGQVDAARSLINEPGPFQPRDLKGRLGKTG
jgi:NADPH-dependent 2,4-dienoyl-CoA reductase/sulfur reductase-like enzyme